jgi:hypothetical protein
MTTRNKLTETISEQSGKYRKKNKGTRKLYRSENLFSKIKVKKMGSGLIVFTKQGVKTPCSQVLG